MVAGQHSETVNANVNDVGVGGMRMNQAVGVRELRGCKWKLYSYIIVPSSWVNSDLVAIRLVKQRHRGRFAITLKTLDLNHSSESSFRNFRIFLQVEARSRSTLFGIQENALMSNKSVGTDIIHVKQQIHFIARLAKSKCFSFSFISLRGDA